MVSDQITEVIFVGIPGPTHHYGGLSADNVASSLNRGSVSNPKQAALQVLELPRLLAKLGVPSAILPPQVRPHLPLLSQHYKGEPEELIRQAAGSTSGLLEKASSAAAMWTANAATVAPPNDCADHKLHITTANLFSNLHRRIEAEDTYKTLKRIFQNVPDTIVHAPLSAAMGLHDEGAANHMRLSPGMSAKGLHVFVYGSDGGRRDPEPVNSMVSARQSLSASKAVQQQHKIDERSALFLRQNPDAIRAGVFHNDVIAVNNEYVLLVHEKAYDGGRQDIERISQHYRAMFPSTEPIVILVTDAMLTMQEAVQTYLFNSQIVTRADGGMTLIAPAEVALLYEAKALTLLEKIRADSTNPIDDIQIVDLRQSMRNGGGPACLRLRVPMRASQFSALRDSVRVLADEALLSTLEEIICTHYPDELTAQDLANPSLYHRSAEVVAAFNKALGIAI